MITCTLQELLDAYQKLPQSFPVYDYCKVYIHRPIVSLKPEPFGPETTLPILTFRRGASDWMLITPTKVEG